VENKQFKPFVPAERVMPEFTVFSVILGILLAVVGVSADISGIISLGNIGGIVAYAILLFTLFAFATKGAKKK